MSAEQDSLMASFERVYPVRLSSLCRHLVGTGRVTSTDEKDELMDIPRGMALYDMS